MTDPILLSSAAIVLVVVLGILFVVLNIKNRLTLLESNTLKYLSKIDNDLSESVKKESEKLQKRIDDISKIINNTESNLTGNIKDLKLSLEKLNKEIKDDISKMINNTENNLIDNIKDLKLNLEKLNREIKEVFRLISEIEKTMKEPVNELLKIVNEDRNE